MFSIKSSFADCSKCKLLHAPSCILETNCENDMTKVDIIIIAENPADNEIKNEKPLVGRAGKIFRAYFDRYIKLDSNYLLTNCVLCQTLDENGKTSNPDNETIELCKINCFKIIEKCNPKLIVLMGASPIKAFGFFNNSMKDLRGKLLKWNNYDVLLTYHPSYIARKRNTDIENDYKNDLIFSGKYIKKEMKEIEKVENIKANRTGIEYYNIPDKYYTNNYTLVDVQYLYKTSEVLYIFRDKNNKKEYYTTNDSYYYYEQENPENARHIVPYDELTVKYIPYKNRYDLNKEICYEGDLRITSKHAIDYYIKKKEEEFNCNLKIGFLDIETYTGKSKEFPNPAEAKYPICLITMSYDGNLITYCLDPKNNQKINVLDDSIIIFNNEVSLLEKFISDVRKSDIDIIAGWNSNDFDLNYIFNRCRVLGIDFNKISKFDEVLIIPEKHYYFIGGMILLDLLPLYKSFTFGNKENYRLGTIAQLELGYSKLEFDEGFSSVYEKDINKFIEYNRRDVSILVDLENKLGYINLQNELRRICTSSFEGVSSDMGQIDTLILSYLKRKNLASRNSQHTQSDKKIPGAYVKPPIPGLYEYFVDFDFSSLYPSIKQTFNIGINTFVCKFSNYLLGYDFIYNIDSLPEEFEIIFDPTFKSELKKINKNDFIKFVKENNLVYTINGCFYKNHKEEISISADVLNSLLNSRKVYKQKMFEAKQSGDKLNLNIYNTRQLVYKVLANTAYGVLVNSHFRFYNIDLGSSITLTGREALKTSIVEANAYVDKLKDGNYYKPNVLSKEDMFTSEPMSVNSSNIITGDTDSVFVCYQNLIDKKLSEEEILKNIRNWCEEIQNHLNNIIMKNLVEKHNIDFKFNKLNLKNELVCKRGNFLAKKRYMIYVIEQEGKKVDEIVNMGIEIKRSDFPNYTKEGLKELIDILLKSETISIKNIFDFIENKKNDFLCKIKGGEKIIARPVSFTKNEGDYKVVPQGVRAMLAWNKLEYDIFNTGSRGYLYKINGIDLEKCPSEIKEKYLLEYVSKGEKLEIIAIPDEEIKLPSYYIIDEMSMLKFSWEDRYNLILNEIVKEDHRPKNILKF